MPRPQRNTRRLLAAAARGLERRAEGLRLSRRRGRGRRCLRLRRRLGLGRLRGVGGRFFVRRSFLRRRGLGFLLRGRGLVGLGLGGSVGFLLRGRSFIGGGLLRVRSLLVSRLLRGRSFIGSSLLGRL